jgi:serine/threonine-protein kinase HipA
LTDEVQLAEFVRRLIFNAGIGNNARHLRSWSLIYPDGRTPQLAPAYDSVSTVLDIADDRLIARLLVQVHCPSSRPGTFLKA